MFEEVDATHRPLGSLHFAMRTKHCFVPRPQKVCGTGLAIAGIDDGFLDSLDVRAIVDLLAGATVFLLKGLRG